MAWGKKAQGVGGILKVVVVGIFVLAIFPFVYNVINNIAGTFEGVLSWLIMAIVFVFGFLFIRFAYLLGADS